MLQYPHVFDVTMELRDEYTALVNRQSGADLQIHLEKKLKETSREGGILLLDFSVVTSIHQSFFDEFLVPVLKRLVKGGYENRYIFGVGVDPERLTLSRLDRFLQIAESLFVVYDKHGKLMTLGASDEIKKAVAFVRETHSETSSQLAVQMGVTKQHAEELLDHLVLQRVLIKGHSDLLGIDYYDFILDRAVEERIISRSLMDELLQRIEDLNAIEQSVHYILPSGLHAGQFLHFSRILEDARFSKRIGIALVEKFRDAENIDAILTARTPNNLVLAHAAGDYLEAKIISAVQSVADNTFHAVPELALKRGMNVVVLVDVIASGWMVERLSELVARCHANLEGVVAAVKVSKEIFSFSVPNIVVLSELPLEVYQPDRCALCDNHIPRMPALIVPQG